jgi:glycosyltransferase involved in cell wall biosynthesis
VNEQITLDKNYSTTRRVIKDDLHAIERMIHSCKLEEEHEKVLFLPHGENLKGAGGLRTQGYFKVGGFIPDSTFSQLRKNKENAKDRIQNPQITVVTVVFNGEQTLEETILSVLNQTYDNVEYIIVDGGSTDGTLDIIRKYEHLIDYWVSENDKGIYDAMNKGIALATGNWINFMNAGDRFVSEVTLTNLGLEEMSDYVLVYGNKIQGDQVRYPLDLKILELGEIMACHQSMFFNLGPMYRSAIFYDLTYKIYGDYELVNRLYLKFKGFYYLNQNVAFFAGGGISSMVSTQKRKDKYRAIWHSYGLFGLLKAVLYRVTK